MVVVAIFVMSGDKQKHPFWRGKVLPRLALMFVPFPKNTFCSIDVTSKCNLRCKHCYFFSYDQTKNVELTNEQWLSKIETMQKGRHPFYNCTWVGGEPLLRKDLIEKGRHLFKSNKVVTNGTLPLPEWPDVDFHISVDGTEKYHDSIRGEGTYKKLKHNITNASHLKVIIACCINRSNVECLENFLEEWSRVPHVKYVLIDFFTPTEGAEEGLWLNFEERDEVLDKLIRLKKEKYGDFLGGPKGTFELMRSKNKHAAVGKNCVFVKHGSAFCSDGSLKKPCVIGPKADCNRCGCIVPFSVRAWKSRKNLMREIWQAL